MTENPKSDSLGRRRLLKSMGATATVVTTASLAPDSWTRPIIKMMALPAHAQTSGPTTMVFGTGVLTTKSDAWWEEHDTLLAGLLDTVVPPAHANGAGFEFGVTASICGSNREGGGSYEITFEVMDTQVMCCFSGQGDYENCTGQAMSTLNSDNTINDIVIEPIDATTSDANQQEKVALVGLNMSGNDITGFVQVETIVPTPRPEPVPNAPPPCGLDMNTPFTASLQAGSPFTCVEECTLGPSLAD